MGDHASFKWSSRMSGLSERLTEVAGTLRDRVRATATIVAKAAARRRRHIRERRIIVASGLFDAEYYRTQGPVDGDPIRHYLTRGVQQGRSPHPLFDTVYYRKRYPDVASAVVNPLVHYLAVGGAQGRLPNPYFDGQLYLSQVPPLEPAATNPLVHFVTDGARSGRRTSLAFDPEYYLERHPEVRTSGMIPLVHYLAYGSRLGFSPGPGGPIPGTGRLRAPPPVAPTDAEWSTLARPASDEPRVDVIVPVFRGEADTLRAIHRVLASRNRTSMEVVVIDDCSPEPALSARLRTLGAEGHFTYLRNDVNRGFVGTVNRGMALHPDRDVVLLNSDTEVFHDWLDRLRDAAASNGDVGTITPFSNSATICSYPTFVADNDMALELSYDELDSLAAETNRGPGSVVDLPTAVGFCMYITRECLNATGVFDEEHFGKGYGEENDFCRRALALGFRSVLAGNVFVRHTGSASFQGEKAERVERALAVLRKLHPDYDGAVRSFIERDPIRPLRERLDVARTRRALGRRSVALVTHNLGGGTERHVRDLEALAKSENVGVLILRPDETSPGLVRVYTSIEAPLPNHPTLPLDDVEASLRFFESVGVRHVHVHHLAGFSDRAPTWVEGLARSSRVTVDFTIHDYAPICPRINLIDASGTYCGEPDEASCNRCVSTLGSEFGKPKIGSYRARQRSMLASVRQIFVPNADVETRITKHFPELAITVRPHPEPRVGQRVRAVFMPGQRLRIAVLGGIRIHKGFELLVACAEDARARSLPLDFVVVGYTHDDARAHGAGIEITGPYATDDEAYEALERAGSHACFFPAVWPETYSYTLSIALNADLHPVAFDLGAIAERLRSLEGGTLLPLAWMRDPARVNDTLVTLASSGMHVPHTHTPPAYVLADYYGDRV